ncbi:MAG: ABC transporter permease [Clostridia bacterium]|nr:ABC transporter permease [Clostridia bacterium]
MRGALRYLRAEAKRFLRVYPAILALILVTCICIGAAAAIFFSADDEKDAEAMQKIKIGIVGNLEDTYLKLAVNALQNMDASNYYADMITMDLETAKKELDRGEIAGYLLVPEGYVDSVISGGEDLLTYVMKDTTATFMPQLMSGALTTVSHYVTTSESCIYSYTDLCRDRDIPRSTYRPTANNMSFEYVSVILDRENATKTEYIGDIIGLDLKEYYVCALFCLAILLFGLCFAPLLIKERLSLQRLLLSKGTGSAFQVAGEFFMLFILQALNCLIMLSMLFFIGKKGISLGISISDTNALFSIFFSLLPCVLVLCAMQFFLYELSSGVISGVLMGLFSTIALSFISGFFFPLNSLPKSIASFSAVIPTGYAFTNTMSVLLRGETSALAPLLLWSAGLLLCSCIIREIRIRRVGK